MEQKAIEKEIFDKAKEWANDYGEEFLVELIDVFLDEVPSQLAALRRAADRQDASGVSREAHSLKSSSANMGAETLAAMAAGLEIAARGGTIDNLSAEVRQLEDAFAAIKNVLETLRRAPAEYIGEER
jgi:two-component system, sensor histidine kinase and response regulator